MTTRRRRRRRNNNNPKRAPKTLVAATTILLCGTTILRGGMTFLCGTTFRCAKTFLWVPTILCAPTIRHRGHHHAHRDLPTTAPKMLLRVRLKMKTTPSMPRAMTRWCTWSGCTRRQCHRHGHQTGIRSTVSGTCSVSCTCTRRAAQAWMRFEPTSLMATIGPTTRFSAPGAPGG
jgi:hypothetical protein